MTAIHKRGSGDIWQGLWTVPEAGHLTSDLCSTAILLQKDVKHVLTHRIILADFYLLTPQQQPTLPSDFIWIKEEDGEIVELFKRLLKPTLTFPKGGSLNGKRFAQT